MSDPHRQNPDVRYEPKDFRLRHLGWLALILTVLIGGGMLGVYWFYGDETLREHRAPGEAFHHTHGPGYETPIAADMRSMLTENLPRLTRFAWIDEAEGTCRIPLHLAGAAIAERGPPAAWREQPPEHPERKEAWLDLRINRQAED